MKTIFEDAEGCVQMLEESPDDKEVIEMVEEEKELLVEQLDDLYDTIIGSILEPLKYDDCGSATMEFRPGIFELIV